MIECFWELFSNDVCKVESFFMTEIERSGVIKFCSLILNSLSDFWVTMTKIRTPKAGKGVKNLTPIAGFVIKAFSPIIKSRGFFKSKVWCKRHPIGCHMIIFVIFLIHSTLFALLYFDSIDN